MQLKISSDSYLRYFSLFVALMLSQLAPGAASYRKINRSLAKLRAKFTQVFLTNGERKYLKPFNFAVDFNFVNRLLSRFLTQPFANIVKTGFSHRCSSYQRFVAQCSCMNFRIRKLILVHCLINKVTMNSKPLIKYLINVEQSHSQWI